MLNLKLIDEDVLDDILESMVDDMSDATAIKSAQDKIAMMTSNEALGYYLIWNGIIGYTSAIIKAYESLVAAEVKP